MHKGPESDNKGTRALYYFNTSGSLFLFCRAMFLEVLGVLWELSQLMRDHLQYMDSILLAFDIKPKVDGVIGKTVSIDVDQVAWNTDDFVNQCLQFELGIRI